MRNSRRRQALVIALAGVLGFGTTAQGAVVAALLPNGEQTFVDANGVPLAGGSVAFYIPSTSTPKTTWVDPGEAVANANPVVLDGAGRAIIYGSGQYREVVKDASGNTIWDQLTNSGVVNPAVGPSTTVVGDLATWANTTGTLLADTTGPSFLDSAFCNTAGYLIARLTAHWACAQGIPINVVWLGADATGATDNATLITSVLASANGNPVFFPAGSYLFSSAVAVSVPVNVYGVGTGAGPGPATQANSGITQLLIGGNTDLFAVTSIYPSIFHDFQVNVPVSSRPMTNGAAIHLVGTTPTPVANYKIYNVGFTHVYQPIAVLRPQWGTIEGCYFDTWGDGAITLVTSSGVEGSGGFIRGNFFFGTSSTTTSPIYSEVGYTIIDGNEILGGPNGVTFNVKNSPAGFIKVTNDTIENFASVGVSIGSADGSLGSMVMIQGDEFSDNANSPTASIAVLENTSVPAWITDVIIAGNVSRNNTASGGRHIWIQAGKNVQVINNLLDELGSNSPQGITVQGATINTGLGEPFLVADNSFLGTFGARYASQSGITLRDLAGGTVASFASGLVLNNGSQVFFTDGTPGSSPCTGSSTGSMAFLQNSAWKCF